MKFPNPFNQTNLSIKDNHNDQELTLSINQTKSLLPIDKSLLQIAMLFFRTPESGVRMNCFHSIFEL